MHKRSETLQLRVKWRPLTNGPVSAENFSDATLPSFTGEDLRPCRSGRPAAKSCYQEISPSVDGSYRDYREDLQAEVVDHFEVRAGLVHGVEVQARGAHGEQAFAQAGDDFFAKCLQ